MASRKKHKFGIHKGRQRTVKADEVYQYGPLTLARFGKIVQFSNDSTPEEHAETLKRAGEAHTKASADLEVEVPKLQAMVAKYDPVELMHRAAYVFLPLFLKYRLESEYSKEETYSLPTVEYLQYLISRTPDSKYKPAPSEAEWDELWAQAVKIMQLMEGYLFTRPRAGESTDEIYALRFNLDQMRLMMRVKRYPVHLRAYLETSLAPFASNRQSAHGVTAEAIIDGLMKIDDYQKTGLPDRYRAMIVSATALQAKMEALGYSTSEDSSPEELEAAKKALELPELSQMHLDAQEKARLALTPAVFDITHLTSLPKSILALLSVKPGESILTSLTDEHHDDLSPISPSVLHYKPFLEVDGRYYTFYHTGFEDHMADIIEADLLASQPSERTKLEKARSDFIEEVAKDLLSTILKPDFALLNVYYPNPDDLGALTELDVLIGVDDLLFLVEVKSGGISAGAKRGAPKDLASTLSDLIFEGQRQSERAERYLKSAGTVDFFDHTGKKVIKSINQKDFRKLYRVVVTRESLGWIGARLAQLSILDPTLSSNLPWHISLDDLRVISELFAGRDVQFAHYLEERLQAGKAPELTQHDEIEHVGLYNKMNIYHDLPVKGQGRLTFDASFMHDIDRHYAKLAGGEPSDPPVQEMPPKMSRLLEELSASRLSKRFQLASGLLDLDSKGREQFEQIITLLEKKNIEHRQSTVRMPLTRASFGMSFTLTTGANWDAELKRSAVQLKLEQAKSWLIAQFQGDGDLKITRIAEVFPSTYSEKDIEETKAIMEKTDTQKVLNPNKIGRNQPCYCGSGKKYKKCHGIVL